MIVMPAGVTACSDAYDDVVWRILGQTYTLKQQSDASMAWHAIFPPGTFVPPHVHPTQDEFIYVIEGELELLLDGQNAKAAKGDLIRMPMNVPHGIFNKSGKTVTCLFWVSPTAKLRGLFDRIHDLADPAEIVRIAPEHDIHFLPPAA